jgi:hypothetical protein
MHACGKGSAVSARDGSASLKTCAGIQKHARLFVVVALFSVTTTVVLQKVLGRTFVMVQLCHSNDFGSV